MLKKSIKESSVYGVKKKICVLKCKINIQIRENVEKQEGNGNKGVRSTIFVLQL